jgi:hypothetical protein
MKRALPMRLKADERVMVESFMMMVDNRRRNSRSCGGHG